jgi:predicted transcriptional regulator of viral defense system
VSTGAENSRWNQLFELASTQHGMFSAKQAATVGYSPQLIHHHVAGGRLKRLRHGLYRMVHFPASEHEELTTTWLWSEQVGVFSNQTALLLHDLSDVLPSQAHMTLPAAWLRRRLRVPERVVLHYGDISESEKTWFGVVPLTTVLRTLQDCVRDSLSPELLFQATKQALRRGLVTKDKLGDVKNALKGYGRL